MTDELQELEPLEEPVIEAAPPAAPGAPAPNYGLAAPAYSRSSDKQYFRFLLAGVVMFLGCLMPFGPDWNMAGYKTLGGSFAMFVAVGLIWSWWGAISTNRFSGANLKWVGLAIVPLLLQVLNLIYAFDAPAVKDFIAAGESMPTNWGEFFDAQFALKDPAEQLRADNFIRAFGLGKIVVFLGALLAELSMLMAVFGGAKHAKAQKSGAAPKRRR